MPYMYGTPGNNTPARLTTTRPTNTRKQTLRRSFEYIPAPLMPWHPPVVRIAPDTNEMLALSTGCRCYFERGITQNVSYIQQYELKQMPDLARLAYYEHARLVRVYIGMLTTSGGCLADTFATCQPRRIYSSVSRVAAAAKQQQHCRSSTKFSSPRICPAIRVHTHRQKSKSHQIREPKKQRLSVCIIRTRYVVNKGRPNKDRTRTIFQSLFLFIFSANVDILRMNLISSHSFMNSSN